MLFEKIDKITTSLRFQLTLIYSVILFIFASTFVLGLNVYLNNKLKYDPEFFHTAVMKRPRPRGVIIEFNDDQIETIIELRLEDIKQIQKVSLLSLIPISLLSFMLGYIVSGWFLSPLKLLQRKVKELEDKNLGAQVDIDTNDEVGDLAREFNEMSLRLKRAFDAQTQFVQDASHELRTPLTVIRTNLEMGIDDPKISKREMKESIESALLGIKRATELTEYLLDLSLPEKINKKKVDIVKLVTEQVKSLEPIAKKSNVELILDVPKKTINKSVDSVLLGRAIFNLIDNAVKYSIKVKNPRVEVSLSNKQSVAEISIKDNGPGIPKEMQEKIFERFFRVDKSRSRDSGGFGLGLAISKKIIEEHGGEIELTSSKKGSIFKIILS